MCRHGDRQDARSIHGTTGALVYELLGPMGLGEAAMYLRHSSNMTAFASGALPNRLEAKGVCRQCTATVDHAQRVPGESGAGSAVL